MKKLIAVMLLFSTLFFVGCSDEPAQTVSAAPGLSDVVGLDEQSEQSEDTYLVTRVVDGDTIIVDVDGTEERIRMIGIDTPESVHPDADRNVEYGKVASAFTREKLQDQNVTLEYDVEERDRYGRILAYVWLDGEMLNKTLLQEGHAKVATYPPNVKYVDDFTALQEQARDNEKGVWAYDVFEKIDPALPIVANNSSGDSSEVSSASQSDTKQPEVAYTYVGNSNTKKFHESGCRSVKQMAAHNIVAFETRDDAINRGYDPCKVCNP